MAEIQGNMKEQLTNYFEEEGFVDRSTVDVRAQLRLLGPNEGHKFIQALAAQQPNGANKGLYYTLAAERVNRIPIYELLTSKIYEAKKNMLLDNLNFGNIRPGSKVLDVGCGTGLDTNFLGYIVGPEGEVIGTDITEAALNVARERAEKRNLSNVRFISADRDKLPFEDNYFDTVLLTLSFNDGETKFGLLDILRYRKRMKGINRVLKEGGRVCMIDNSKPEQNKSIVQRASVQMGLGGFFGTESFVRNFTFPLNPYSYVFSYAEKGK